MSQTRDRRRPPARPFPPGAANPASRQRRPQTGAGRQPGSGNRITKDVRVLFMEALEAAGGKEWLLKRAKSKNSRERIAFMAAVSKLIPVQMSGLDDGPIQFQITADDANV